MSIAYPLMFSLGNQDHLPPGDLPKHYQGDPYWSYANCKKEEHYYSDSNRFKNPFMDFEDDDPFIRPIRKSQSHEILGVDPDADEEEIKQAFRKKALETHPDKGGDPDEFKKVREAYECLIS